MSLYKDASLVMIPSAYKDGKLYSIRPTDGSGDFTFSRGSNLAATRVDVNGLIEKGRENLLLQSNQFDTTWLSDSSVTHISGQSGYDGSNDAWLISKGAFSYQKLYQDVTTSGVWTFSIYAKEGTLGKLTLRVNDDGTRVVFNLDDGSVYGFIDPSSKLVDYGSSDDLGSGWRRYHLTYNGSLTRIQVYPDFGETDAGNIYIQDSQLESGLVSTSVIETTTTSVSAGILEDMPRLDYSGSCPSLLLEPQRTNGITQSEYSGVYSLQNISLTDNFATSPEGYDNAFKAVPNTTNSQHIFFRSGMGNAADTYTQSIFAKANGYNFCFIRFDLLTRYAFFDLQNGTTAYTDSDITSSITDMGNGWYRCTATMTTTQYANAVIGVAEAGDSQADIDFTGDGASSVLFYGHQSELGSYPTSYIPCMGTSQTRSVEQLYTLEDSSLFDLEQGTFFLEMSALEDDGTDRKISISDGTNDNMVNIGFSRFTGNINGEVISNGVLQTSGFAATGVTQTNNNKFALVWGNGEHRFYVNGVKTKESSISNSPVGMDILRFAQGNGSQRTFLNNKQILVFPTALTDSECIALTTL